MTTDTVVFECFSTREHVRLVETHRPWSSHAYKYINLYLSRFGI